MPPPRPRHLKLQTRVERLLQGIAGDRGVVRIEFPYRPVHNLQYWIADVAYIPLADWDAMPPDQYPVYAPPLIIEVLSPSNTPAKLNRQRIVAMSGGTQEFRVLDADTLTVQVTGLTGTKVYTVGDVIPLPLFGDATIAVEQIFAV